MPKAVKAIQTQTFKIVPNNNVGTVRKCSEIKIIFVNEKIQRYYVQFTILQN